MKRIFNITEYLLSFLIVVDCNTIYRQYISGSILYSLCAIILVSLIVTSHRQLNLGNLFRTLLFVLIIPFFYIYQLVEIPFTDNFRSNLFLVYFFCIFPLFIVYFNFVKFKLSLFYKFSSIISWLALYSSILWFLCSFLQIVQLPHVILNNWAEKAFVPSFYYIYFETQLNVFLGFELVRNSAIFAEAPMFAICLYVSLIIELLLKNKTNKWHVLFLLFGIVTSISSTAYIITMIIFSLRFITKHRNNKFSLFILLLFLLFVFFVISFLLDEKESDNAVSYYSRLEGYIKGWEVFLNNPLFGKGFYSQTESNSNSIMVLLSEIGSIGAFPFLLGLLLVPIILLKNFRTRAVGYAGLVFFLGYSFTIVTYCLISILFTTFFISFIKFDYLCSRKQYIYENICHNSNF